MNEFEESLVNTFKHWAEEWKKEERERCAKIAEELTKGIESNDSYYDGWSRAAELIAKAIRDQG